MAGGSGACCGGGVGWLGRLACILWPCKAQRRRCGYASARSRRRRDSGRFSIWAQAMGGAGQSGPRAGQRRGPALRVRVRPAGAAFPVRCHLAITGWSLRPKSSGKWAAGYFPRCRPQQTTMRRNWSSRNRAGLRLSWIVRYAVNRRETKRFKAELPLPVTSVRQTLLVCARRSAAPSVCSLTWDGVIIDTWTQIRLSWVAVFGSFC